MSLSKTLHSGDGATTTFPIGLSYLAKAYIKVFVDGSEKSRPSEWDFDGAGTNVEFVTPPASGTDNISIERHTADSARLVDWSSGAQVSEENLDRSDLQLFHLLQENKDETNEARMGKSGGVWDAEGLRIKNVGAPVDADDAVDKTFADAQVAAAQGHADDAEASADAAATSASQAAALQVQCAQHQLDTESARDEAAFFSKERGRLAGLAITRTSGTEITVGPGEVTMWDGSNLKKLLVERVNNITKNTTAGSWQEGSGGGGLPAALHPLQANTTYHIFAISKANGGLEIGFDTSLTATNLLAAAAGNGYVYYRRLHSFRTGGTGIIPDLVFRGDLVLVRNPTLYTASGVSTTPTNHALPTVPTGVEVDAMLRIFNDNQQVLLVTSPLHASATASRTASPLANVGAQGATTPSTEFATQLEVRTNTSREVRISADGTVVLAPLIAVVGWRDRRGKDD